MKLTLKERREIVRRFKDGETIHEIALEMWGADEFLSVGDSEGFEQVLRDYMNGKFSLSKPKPKSKELDYPRRRG